MAMSLLLSETLDINFISGLKDRRKLQYYNNTKKLPCISSIFRYLHTITTIVFAILDSSNNPN